MNRRAKKKQFKKVCVRMMERLKNNTGVCLVDGVFYLFDMKSCILEPRFDDEGMSGNLDVCFKDCRKLI